MPIKGTYFFLFTCASASKRLDVRMERTSTMDNVTEIVAMTSIGEEDHAKNIVSSLSVAALISAEEDDMVVVKFKGSLYATQDQPCTKITTKLFVFKEFFEA